MFNLGLLSDAALTGLTDTEKESMQKQATQQFLLGSLLSGDPGIGFKSAMDIPSTSLNMQKMIRDSQIAQRQQDELAAFTSKFAPTEAQAGRRALNATLGREPDLSSPYALANKLGAPLGRVEPQLVNQPIDYQQALSESLRLAGNPAQPQIRETLTAMQPKFVGDLRVDASGKVVGSVPTSKDGVQQQLNLATGQYAANPVQNYMMSRLMTTPPEVSANTMLGVGPTGAIQQMAIPGSESALTSVEGAKAIGQASGQVEQVIGADGKTYFVPRSSLLTQRPTGVPTGAQVAVPAGGVSTGGAVAKVSPGQATLDAATSERFKTFSNESLAGANSASGRKIAAQQLYDLSTQIQNNKLTGLQAGAYSYMNAIPGIGKLFEQDITDVTRMNQAIATAQLEKTAQQKGAASNLDAQVIARGYATLTDPASATRMLAAQEEALADKDIARNQFVENYTGDPGKISTAWGNSPDNKPIFTHPKFNQFLSEQVNAWSQAGAQGKPVLPAGFTFGTGKKSGEFQIKRPDGSIYRIGQ
jgi:hypothetical protein